MVDSKDKGNKYEKKISKKLSLWYSNDKKKDIFYRTAGSGSKATVSDGINFNYYGDIGYRDDIGKPFIELFCIEAKHYKDFSLLDVLKDNKNPSLIEEFWAETKKEADESNRYRMLVMKKNYFPDLIMIDKRVYEYIEIPTNNYIVYDGGIIMQLKDFLDNTDPQTMVKQLEEVH